MACLAEWRTHYLGPNNVDSMATKAEQKLQLTVYNGKQRRRNFEKYVNVTSSSTQYWRGWLNRDILEEGLIPALNLQ